MEIKITAQADKDLQYWKKINDLFVLKKIKHLLESIRATPFAGIGKPEPLKSNLRSYWSKRINHEHRLVYRVDKNVITIIQCRFDYE